MLRHGSDLPVWDELSEFEQFAMLVHSDDSEHRFMALMNVAYCDESADSRPPRVFSVSGYLGRAPDWFDLGRRWGIALREEGLEKTGFHMAHCEAGLAAPYHVSREERDRLQRRFIGIINDTPLWGYAVAIELDAYQEIVGRTDYKKPYYIAFQYAVERMALVLEENHFRRGECIAFVFDQQQEHEGKAKSLYESLQSSDLKYVHRLGSLTFDSRFARLQLQAADVLAYESMRHFREGRLQGKGPRWQYRLLRSVRGRAKPEIRFFGRSQIETLAKRAVWRA